MARCAEVSAIKNGNRRNFEGIHMAHRSLGPGILSGLLLLTLTGCQGGRTLSGNATQETAELGDWGVQTQYIDTAIATGDDFYRHVNQGWLDSATIPAGYPMNGAFVDVTLRTQQQLRTLIDELAHTTAPEGSPEQQLADFYASYVDVERRNTLGMSMLMDEVGATMAADNRDAIVERMAVTGYDAVVGIGVGRDPGNPRQYRLNVAQGGLGLPGRDYYLAPSDAYADIRQAYLSYIEGVLRRGGLTEPAARAEAVLGFETSLAKAHWTPARAREALDNYHVMTRDELAYYAPGFNWALFFRAGGYDDADPLVVNTDSAIRDTAALFAATPLDTLRAYTVFHYLDNYAPLLSQVWEDAHFDLYSRKLAGIDQPRTLDERALDVISQVLGEQLGQRYVERYFPPASKDEMEELVGFLKAAFRKRLQANDWMDAATRQAAFTKLDAFTTRIGYPDRWHDYSSMTIRPDDLVGNINAILEWKQDDSQAKLRESARQWEWEMTPQTVNAYYNPVANEIVFPAAILQPPFFDPDADPAVNFGTIGMVIGHEMSHGFDDQGSRYDDSGTLRNWWTPASRERFEEKAAALVKQFSAYTPLEGIHVNGQLTLGENIGDMGGIAVAWAAWQQYAEERYQGSPPVLDGYTGDERFFLGYAQLWRTQWLDGSLRQVLVTDPHSPGEFRVNGILRNFDPWYATFEVAPEAALYLTPRQRVSIW